MAPPAAKGLSKKDAGGKGGAAAKGKAGAVAGAGPKKKKDEVVGPKPKSFRVQAHIIEVKDVKSASPGLPDLVVMGTVGTHGSKYTQVIRQSTSATFDSFLEWKFTMTFEEFSEAELHLQVLNANTDAKSESLGMYHLKLQQIRKQPMGEYFMVWLALYSDPDEYATELSGSLRCTLTCLGGMQQVPTHTEDEVMEAYEDDSPLVLMPHLVRWSHYSLFVAVYRVEGLPNMDEYGSTDGFVSIKLPGQAAMKTKVVPNSLNPVFNELLRLPVQLPLLYDTLTVSVSDYDQGGCAAQMRPRAADRAELPPPPASRAPSASPIREPPSRAPPRPARPASQVRRPRRGLDLLPPRHREEGRAPAALGAALRRLRLRGAAEHPRQAAVRLARHVLQGEQHPLRPPQLKSRARTTSMMSTLSLHSSSRSVSKSHSP